MGVWQPHSWSPNCSLSVLLISLFPVLVSFSRRRGRRARQWAIAPSRAAQPGPDDAGNASCHFQSRPRLLRRRLGTQAFIFQTFSINQLKCWQQHGKMFNSLLSSSSSSRLRLHLADKGACVSVLDPASPARLAWAERKLYLGPAWWWKIVGETADKTGKLIQGSAI